MDYKEKYESWLKDPALCEEGKAELSSIAGDEKAIEYRFGAQLEFGTAGMRGIIGYGTNMMNVYTVRRATQGLCGIRVIVRGGLPPRRGDFFRYPQKVGRVRQSRGGRSRSQRRTRLAV
ncbi:MAG: hypothetical protein ACLRTQ_09520 [Candidatus Borkfalkia sp.]